jgi:ribosomal protein L12E/L44/L45/RPP1/RPP2
MSSKYEYHQILKYLYHEGYASSYEDAEYIVENMSDEQYEELYENVFSSASMPAASAGAAKGAADKHRKAAETATSASLRKGHRDSAARYEVTARRMSMTADHYEFLSDYLINENFASNLNAAHAIIESMSEEWIQSIFEENLNEVTGLGRVAFRLASDALKRGMATTPARKTALKLSKVGRDIQKLQKTGTVRELQNAEERARRLNVVDKSRSLVRNKPEWWGAAPPQRGYGSR